MKKPTKSLAVTYLALLAVCLAGGCRKHLGRGVTINGFVWTVELAATPEQRYQGLSGRQQLTPNAGMLFIFPRPQPLSFCMRGCRIPLDIAFISSDLKVIETHTMAVEPDLAGHITYSCETAAQYALEVPAGALQKAGVKVGDRVHFSADIADAAKGLPGL